MRVSYFIQTVLPSAIKMTDKVDAGKKLLTVIKNLNYEDNLNMFKHVIGSMTGSLFQPLIMQELFLQTSENTLHMSIKTIHL